MKAYQVTICGWNIKDNVEQWYATCDAAIAQARRLVEDVFTYESTAIVTEWEMECEMVANKWNLGMFEIPQMVEDETAFIPRMRPNGKIVKLAIVRRRAVPGGYDSYVEE